MLDFGGLCLHVDGVDGKAYARPRCRFTVASANGTTGGARGALSGFPVVAGPDGVHVSA